MRNARFFTLFLNVEKGVKMKSDTQFKFTDRRVKSIVPHSKTKTYSDNSFNNLKLTVTSSGTRTFYVRFKVKNRPVNHRLGDASCLSVDEARSRAVNYMNLKAQHQVDYKVSLSVDCIFKLYKANELSARQTIAGRTHALEISYLKHLRPRIGNKPIGEINKKFARALFLDLENLGYSVHNRCLTAIKSAFNYVVEYEDDLDITLNPFVGIKKMTEVRRNRYLTQDEAKRLLLSLNQESNQDIADIYRVALFTGARLSNVKMMKWHEIDFSSHQWLIPATNTKTKTVYQIPLHNYVLELLKRRQKLGESSPFVFASKRSKYGYITGGDSVWKSAIKRAGLFHENPNIRPRPHDLRRTFATWQIQSGADISIVSKALCHTSLKHTMIYAHTNVEQVRSSINTAFSFI